MLDAERCVADVSASTSPDILVAIRDPLRALDIHDILCDLDLPGRQVVLYQGTEGDDGPAEGWSVVVCIVDIGERDWAFVRGLEIPLVVLTYDDPPEDLASNVQVLQGSFTDRAIANRVMRAVGDP